ncbi:MAG: hypothetical protein ACI841_001770 [Planctomycetota bacterium]|jgi:hypothetical protein
MTETSARMELVLLDRALARLLERRTELLAKTGVSTAELERQHRDLAARGRGSRGSNSLGKLFAELDRHCQHGATSQANGGQR